MNLFKYTLFFLISLNSSFSNSIQEQYKIISTNEKKYVPNFLIEKNLDVDDINILLKGLKLVSDFLDKTILRPNNINYPNSRILFINSLK